MIRVIFFNLMCLFILSCSGQNKKDIYNHKAIELNNRATELLQRGYKDSAIILFDKAIAVDQTFYVPHSNKVGIYITEKEFDKALYEIEMVITKKSDLAEGWTFAGMLHEGLGDTLVAKRYYNKSVEIFDERILNPEKVEQIIANRLNRAVSLILLGQEKVGKEELRKLKEEKPDYKFIDELIKKNKRDLINETFKNNL